MIDLRKLNEISTEDEQWLNEATERQKNKDWLSHSRKIAVKILMTIREKGIKQYELAEMIGVSAQQVNKIVKGKENLTLETISKLENALGTNLIFEDLDS